MSTSTAQPNTAQISPAQTSAAQPSTAQPSTAQISPAQTSAAQPSTAQTSAGPTSAAQTAAPGLSRERADLRQALAKHRYFLRHTVRGLTDEQAARRTTPSQLCLGGLIKHVAGIEQGWLDFAVGGAAAMEANAVTPENWTAQFAMTGDDTLAGLLERYEQVAARTDGLVASLPDLDQAHPLPSAPWFEPGASWSVRRVLLHVIAETAQHAGHADIIREALDGSRSMG